MTPGARHPKYPTLELFSTPQNRDWRWLKPWFKPRKNHQPENRTEVLRDWSYCCGDALAKASLASQGINHQPPAPPAASNSSVRSLRDWDARANTGDDKPRRFPDQAFPKRISGVRILKGHTTFGCLSCLSLEENRVRSRDSSDSKWLKWLKSILITRFSSNFDPSRLMYSTPTSGSAGVLHHVARPVANVGWKPEELKCLLAGWRCIWSLWSCTRYRFGGLNTWWDYRNIT